jgi:hypothetical protein
VSDDDDLSAAAVRRFRVYLSSIEEQDHVGVLLEAH